jgi:hypothetical protein
MPYLRMRADLPRLLFQGCWTGLKENLMFYGWKDAWKDGGIMKQK